VKIHPPKNAFQGSIRNGVATSAYAFTGGLRNPGRNDRRATAANTDGSDRRSWATAGLIRDGIYRLGMIESRAGLPVRTCTTGQNVFDGRAGPAFGV